MARTTITLDDELARRVRQFVPDRGLNRFVTEAIAEKVRAIERANLEAALREGYIAECSRRDVDLVDWDAIEVEGWPE